MTYLAAVPQTQQQAARNNTWRTNLKISAVILMAGAMLLPSQSFSQNTSRAGASEPVVALVDGKKITLQEFQQKRPLAMFSAGNTYYESERKAVDAYVDDVLLERQAQKEGITVAELLKRNVDEKIGKDPSEEALRVYYDGLDTREPFEAVRGQIMENVRQKRTARVKAAYLASLREAAHVVLTLSPPRAPISLVNTPMRGNANAPLMLVEYADYECPYCQMAEPELEKLRAEYPDKITFAYKDLPLPMHTHAQKAAEAAQCAGSQAHYWEFHDYLLKTKELELPQLKAAARQLGLDTKAFDTCLDSGERAGLIKAVVDEAQSLGLQGTPSFFLNGRFLNGIPKYEQLRQLVDEELKTSAAKTQRAER